MKTAYLTAYLKAERSPDRLGRFRTFWRLLDEQGNDLVQPIFKKKYGAIHAAKELGYELKDWVNPSAKPEAENLAANVGPLLVCQSCGSKRMMQAFKIIGCLDCGSAYVAESNSTESNSTEPSTK